MTISSGNNTPRKHYTVSQGVTQTTFAVTFEFNSHTELVFYVDGVEISLSSSEVSGGNGSTGTITKSVTGATGGSSVVILRNTAIARTTDFPSTGAFDITQLNTDLDTFLYLSADVDDTATRSLRLADYDTEVSTLLPLASARANKVLEFDSSGSPIAVASLTNVATTSASGLMSNTDKAKLDGIEAGADITDATNVEASGAVMETDTTTASMQFVVDEDNMSSNSATKIPTQQSVKAYVDSQVQTKDALSELSGNLDDISDGSSHVKMTNAERTKLTGIETGATADQTDSEIRALVASATDSNVFTDADHTKLDGIETGATADQTASDIRSLGFFDITNDGTGSGLDADKLDGQEGTYYQQASTALTTSTSFGGDVSGTYNSIVIADDSHNHVINNVDGLQDALNAKAPLASPALTGTPTAPTASADTSTTQIATTAFVQQELAQLVDSAPSTLDTLNEIAAAINDDPNFNTTVTNSLANRVRVDTASQGLTSTQKSNARTNIGLTDAEIKTAYENNSDTNAFTDTLLSKLNGIESSATGDQTASEILTAIKTVDGTESGLDADLLDGLHSSSFLRANAQDDKTSGTLRFTDNVQAAFGSSYDMKLYHDGDDSYITNDTGHLYIGANADGDVGGNLYLRAKVTENDTSIILNDDSSIDYYINGSLRMQMFGVINYSYADIRLQGFAYDLVYDKGTYTTRLTSTNPTSQNQTITLPDATGTVLLTNGNGSSLTNLNASNISSGTISTDRLPSLTVAELASDSVTTSSESFADNDTTLMTSAAINDRIESFGYSTTTGTVTSVGTTGTVNGITLTGTVTGSGNLTLGGTLGSITVSQLAGSALTTSAESFADNDTTLMTSAAINDRIESFGYTTNTGDITGVTAGTGLSGGGDSGSVTLNVSGLSVSELAADSLTTSSESFVDNDTTLMTSAAINDRIESFGYTTNTGDITGVTAGTGLSGGGDSGSVTLAVDLSELTDMTAAMVGTDEFIVLDAGADRRKAANEIPLSIFNNDSGFITSADGGNAQTLDSLDSTSFLRSDAADSFSGILTGTAPIELNGGVTYDPSTTGDGTDTATDVALSLGSGARIVGHAAGYIRTLLEWNSSSTLEIGQNNTALINHTKIYGGSGGGVELYEGSSKKFETSSTGGTLTGQLEVTGGVVDLKNSGSQSELRLYCESENAHYAALKAPAHSAFSGNVDITLPATAGTLALTSSNITGNAATATTATSATNSDTVDNKHISVVTSLPGSPDANTIYFVTG